MIWLLVMIRFSKETFLLLHLLIIVFLQVLSFHGPNRATAAGSQKCAHTACNISAGNRSLSVSVDFPFGVEEGCGASTEFLLSGCNTTTTDHSLELLWNGFQRFYKDNSTEQSPPFIFNIVYGNTSLTPTTTPQTVNITWNRAVLDALPNTSCPFNVTDNITEYFPNDTTVDLSHSPLTISSTTSVLFFGCSQINSTAYAFNSSTLCDLYRKDCAIPNDLECFEWKPTTQININKTMTENSCKYFQFMLSRESQVNNDTSWKGGLIQLLWSNDSIPTNSKCNSCLQTSGGCGYDPNNISTAAFQCYCPDGNTITPENCLPSVLTVTSTVDISPSNKNRSIKKIALPVAAASVALLLIIISFVLVHWRRRLKKFYTRNQYPKQLNRSPKYHDNPFPTQDSFQRTTNSLMYEHPLHLSYRVLLTATRSFSEKVGEGGFGEVYRGTLNLHKHPGRSSPLYSKVEIAVKVLDRDSRHSNRQFVNEVSTIGSIHHVNVVRLLGFCTDKSNRILVYEYVANGSLDKWIFSNKSTSEDEISVTNKTVFDWNLRYSIAVGVARGLCYLHEECRHRIVHCDIKPQNILLDENMSAKIADFGLAKLITRRGDAGSVMTMAKGTPGYVAPEFWMGGESRLTTKFDVYSYGMVLLELISGHPNFRGNQSGKVCFPVEAFEATKKGNFRPLLDSNLLHCLSIDELEKLRTATLVALWCVQDTPDRRPSMKEVIQFLEGTMAVPGNPPPPAILTSSTLCSSLNIQSQVQTDLTYHDVAVPSHVENPVLLSGGR